MTTRILALVAVVAAGWLFGAALLMNVVGTVHAWWRFVPTMPYSVALKICLFLVISGIVTGVLKALMGDD